MIKTCGAKPCDDCPWRKTSVAGWLGAAAPERFALSILADTRLPCHQTIDYSDPNWKHKWLDGEQGTLCTGALQMSANICKKPRDPEVPAVEPNDNIFSSLDGFIAYHRTGIRSWDDEEDERAKAAWAKTKTSPWAAPLILAELDQDEDAPAYLETPRNPGADDGKCALCEKSGMTEDHRCFGCGYLICEDCDAESPTGQHYVIDHEQGEWNK